MRYYWKSLTPTEFEDFCGLLLRKSGFTEIRWYGENGNDQGRDLLAEKIREPIPGFSKKERWLVQCKRYTSKPPSINQIQSSLTTARQHKPDAVLLLITSNLRPSAKDWLERVRNEYDFDIYLWEDWDIERIARANQTEFIELFPKIFSSGKSLEFYQSNYDGIQVICNEFPDITVIVHNEYHYQNAIKACQEFFEAIKQNKITFDETSEWWKKSRKK